LFPLWRRNTTRSEDLPPLCLRLAEWQHGELGQALAGAAGPLLAEWLPTLFGFQTLLISAGAAEPALLAASRTRSCAVLAPTVGSVPPADPAAANGRATACAGVRAAAVCAWPDALPVAGESVDVVVSYLALGFSDDPTAVLREAERVLVPGGWLIVLELNPFGLWGLSPLRPGVPVGGRWLPGFRLRDWLHVLGFALQQQRTVLFRPPVARCLRDVIMEGGSSRVGTGPLNDGSLGDRSPGNGALGAWWERQLARWLPGSGALTVLLAQRQVSALRPMRPVFRLPEVRGGLVRPSLQPNQGPTPVARTRLVDRSRGER